MDENTAHLEQLRLDALGIALRHAQGDGVHESLVPELQFIRASQPAQPLPAVYEPGLVLVLQGRKQATLGPEVLRYDPLHCLVVSMTTLPVGQITEASSEHPYICLRLQSTPTDLAALMLDAGPTSSALSEHVGPPCSMNLAPVGAALMDAALRLLRLLDAPHDIPVLAPLLKREVFYRVLTGPLGSRLRALAQADSHSHRIARAIELLRQRYDQPLRVQELADAAHMSTSTLHLHFKQITSLSPLQYQKQLRLQHARRLMLANGVDASHAAIQVGYESASQFSREYRRLFGRPPRDDVTSVRASSAAA